ncbi:MAG: hypothetical protein M1423_06165, partial [Acidobacteria bacterium]|nr:hypothetical protein [Acidobacteriota bacterium]
DALPIFLVLGLVLASVRALVLIPALALSLGAIALVLASALSLGGWGIHITAGRSSVLVGS